MLMPLNHDLPLIINLHLTFGIVAINSATRGLKATVINVYLYKVNKSAHL